MKYHFIGIGGIGMSGLAKILLERGDEVTGSDLAESYVTVALKKLGAHLFIGQRAENVPENAVVVCSTDIAENNPEVVQAKVLNCQIIHRSDLLRILMVDHDILAVTGTHGKTTTSALLTHVFTVAGYNPAFAVGGMLNNVATNAAAGSGEYFIVEADESDGTFLKYPYKAAIVTNIDSDHLAHYGSWNALVEAFKEFLAKAPDPARLFWCHDDLNLRAIAPSGVSYGFSEGSQLRISNFRQDGWNILFDLSFDGRVVRDLLVALTGQHNALNATAVFGLALRYGIDEANIRQALASFGGVKRRLEKKGESGGVIFFDDYAHHPTEIAATIKAFRQAIGKSRLVACFQPHRYSRMRFVVNEIGHAFHEADCVVMTDLYTANEAADGVVSTEIILEQIRNHCGKSVLYISRDNLVEELVKFLQPGDALLTLGAGDITKVGSLVKEVLDGQR